MTEADDQIVMWCGRNVEDMTREELVEALTQLGRLYRDQTARHLHQLGTLSEFREARMRL